MFETFRINSAIGPVTVSVPANLSKLINEALVKFDLSNAKAFKQFERVLSRYNGFIKE